MKIYSDVFFPGFLSRSGSLGSKLNFSGAAFGPAFRALSAAILRWTSAPDEILGAEYEVVTGGIAESGLSSALEAILMPGLLLVRDRVRTKSCTPLAVT